MIQENATLQERHYTDTAQLNEKLQKFKLTFMDMIKKYESMWDGHFDCITVAKHGIALNSLQGLLKHSAPCRTVPK